MDSIEEVNRRFNEQLERQIKGLLQQGHMYDLGLPSEELQSTGIPDLPIRLSSKTLNDKSHDLLHGYALQEIQDLVASIQKPWAIFRYGDSSKAQNLIIGLSFKGKQFLVGLSMKPVVKGNILEINSIRNVFPKDNHEWINWITQGKLLRVDEPKKIQANIDKLRINPVAFTYVDLDSATKIVQNFQNPPLKNQKTMEKVEQERQEFRSYYPDGSLYTVEERKNGQRDGLYREYYINGRLSREWHYKEGKPDGLIREWSPDGTPRYETNFKNGKRDGLSRRYFDNGQIFQENNFKDGELEGLTRVWHPDGRFNYELNYHNGAQISQPVTARCRRAEQKQTTKQSQPKKKRGLGI